MNWNSLYPGLKLVATSRSIVTFSIIWSLLLLEMVILLPNVDLFSALLSSNELNLWGKISFWLDLHSKLLMLLGLIAGALLLSFVLLCTIITGSLVLIVRLHNKGVISRRSSNEALLAGAGATGFSMLGLVMLMPVITISGQALGVGLHTFGIALTLASLAAMFWAIFRVLGLLRTE